MAYIESITIKSISWDNMQNRKKIKKKRTERNHINDI